MHGRTDSHTSQRVIRFCGSFRTSAPGGSRERLNPTDPHSCYGRNDVSALSGRWGWDRGSTYRLYPNIEIWMRVPLGMSNSVYTLPEVPTIGFVRGMTSSSLGVRGTSTAMG